MHLFRSLAAVVLLLPALAAQINISGSVYDGLGGPLLAGNVYRVTGSMTVPAGQTLTMQAGAIVKFNGLYTFIVNGTLNCQGTAVSPVVITSIHDDSVGGDTNGNGNATVAGINQWYGISLRSGSSASTLTHTQIRCTGWGNWAVVNVTDSNPTLTDCTLTDGGYGGIAVNSAARPIVTRCAFERINSQPAVSGLVFDTVQGFHDPVASNCPGGNYMRVDSASPAASTTISANNCIGGVLVYSTSVTIPTGQVLTLNAGVVLKATTLLTFTVDGTLIANGTLANPVVITSYPDDSAGGDTNGNGNANAAGVNQWFGLRFRSGSDASSLTHTQIRCTGWGNWAVVNVNDSSPTFTDCVLTDGGYGGFALDAAALPTVTRCNIQRIQSSPAISGATFDAVANFTDNVASNSPGSNYLRVDDSAPNASVTINANNCLGGVLVYSGSVTVPTLVTLTLNAGVVLKATTLLTFNVDGVLVANGTAASPVVLTSLSDDSAGGDTNGDGSASAAGINQWFGLRFRNGSDASTLTHTQVRCTGWGNWAAVNVNSSSPSLSDCSLTDGGYGGLAVDSGARPSVSNCTFERVQTQPAVAGLTFDAVSNFSHNVASNCSGGNYMRIDSPSVAGSVVIGRDNCIGGVLVYAGSVTVGVGRSMTLLPGVTLKATGLFTVNVSGQLNVYGPVVFTSFADDAYGGDTNGNGNASLPAPSQWYGLRFNAGSTGLVDLALVRFSGWGSWAALECNSAGVALRRCRTEFGGSGGFNITAAAAATDLVAFANTGNGIQLISGSVDVIRATCAYNSQYGMRRSAGWIGAVRSVNSFGNASGGYFGFTAGMISFSNGSGITGGTGNIDVDPLFVSAGAGDVRLLPGSPCIDTGDPLNTPLSIDAIGFPRFLDGDLDGNQRVDMGAYEYDHEILLVSGSSAPGGTLILTAISTPSISLAVLALGLPFPNGLPLLNFGGLFVDPTGPFDTVVVPPNGNIPLTIPAALVGPIPFAFQLIGLGNPFPRGNTSNPIFVTIE